MINTNSAAGDIFVVPSQDPPGKNGVIIFVRIMLVVVGMAVFISILLYRSKSLSKEIQPNVVATPNPCHTSVSIDSAPCQIVVIFDYQKTKKETPELTRAFIEKLLSGLGSDILVKQIIISGVEPIHAIITTPYQQEEQIGKLIMQIYPEYIVSQNRVKLPGIQGE